MRGRYTPYLTATLAALLAAQGSDAAFITTSSAFVVGTGDFFGGSGPFVERSGHFSVSGSDSETVTLTFDRFDPALGTLTGITMTLDSVLRVGTEVFGFSQTGTVTATGQALYDVGGLLTGAIDAPTSTGPSPGNYFTPGGTQDFTLDAAVAVPAGLLSDYIGTGTRILSITETVTLSATNTGGGLIARTRTNQLFTRGWEGTVTFQYDYTPAADPVAAVPEPASLLTLGVGALGMCGYAWRRMKGMTPVAA